MKNFGIFGCGNIANVHAMAIRSITGAKLVGCADVVIKAAATFADNYRIRYYDNLQHMLQDPEIDIVCVCTPNGTHAEIAIEVLKADKHVIVEKPMATTTIDCDKMIEAAKKSKGKIMVISQLRMSNSVVRAKEIIENGQIGKIILCSLSMPYYRSEEYFHNSWRGTLKMDGGGALMNQGIHGVDLLSYLFGGKVDVINGARCWNAYAKEETEFLDSAQFMLSLSNGAGVVADVSYAIPDGVEFNLPYYWQFFIWGTEGMIGFSLSEKQLLVGDNEKQALYYVKGQVEPIALEDGKGENYLTDFLNVVNGEKSVVLPMSEVLSSTRATLEIQKKANDLNK